MTNKSAACLLLGSFSIDDVEGNYYAPNKQFNWSSEENKRVARVARTYEQVRAILYKTTTWNYNVYLLRTTWAYNCTALILCI